MLNFPKACFKPIFYCQLSHQMLFVVFLYHFVFATVDNYDPEGYNPESPALTPAGRHPYRQFIPRVQTQRSNLIGLTSNEGQGSRGTRYGTFSHDGY